MKKMKIKWGSGVKIWGQKILSAFERIVVYNVYGLKDGEKVDVAEPGAKVVIAFQDYMFSNERGLYYFPEEDNFYEDGPFDFEPLLLEDDHKKFLKGRLAEITGIVAEKPIPSSNYSISDHMANEMRKEIDKEILKDIADLAKEKETE